MLLSKIRIPRRALPGCLLLIVGLAQDLLAQGPARTFLLLGGKDTVSIEVLKRTPGHLEGELIVPRAGGRWVYGAQVGSDGLVTALETAYNATSDTLGTPARQRGRAVFETDSIRVTVQAGLFERKLAFPNAVGTLPYFNPSMGMVELAVQRALRVGGDSAQVPLFTIDGAQTLSFVVRRLGPDSVLVDLAGIEARLAVDSTGAVRGGVIPAQDIVVLVREGGHGLAPDVRDYSPPEGAPYTANDVTVPTPAGFSLAGTLTLPNGTSAKRKAPAVITITGSGPQDRDEMIPAVRGYRPFYELADTLGRRGIAVLRLDDRGTFSSGGDFATATSKDFADDIRAAIAYLRQRPDIDARRIALVGHSEGGLIAPMVAADDQRLRGIVLLAGPSQKGREILTYQNRLRFEADTALSTEVRDSAVAEAMRGVDSAAANSPWLSMFLSYDPAATAKRVRVPVLILHGETDRQVTAEQAPALAAAFRAGGNKDVTVQVFPNTNHLFVEDSNGSPAGYTSLTSSKVRPEVWATLVNWLTLRLKP